MVIPDVSDKKIILRTKFAFHAHSLNQAKNRTIIADTIKDILGKDIEIECIIDKTAEISNKPEEIPTQSSTTSIEAISNIFGGAEVLE